MRKTPIWYPEIEAMTLTFAAGQFEIISPLTKYAYNADPAVVLGGTDNYNVYISAVTGSGIDIPKHYTITVRRSQQSNGLEQEVHLHISEVTT